MSDIRDLLYNITDELEKIADKGLNNSNLETAYKLVDMYKDLKNVEYWDVKTEYYDSQMTRRSEPKEERYSVTAYTENVPEKDALKEYIDSKKRYKTERTDECEKRMIDALKRYMDEAITEIVEISKDADCREIRETVARYVNRMKSMI